jgi:hypothetical protein
VNDEDVADDITKCSTIRELSGVVKAIELDVIGQKKIVDAAHLLSYPTKYWSTSPVNIRSMFHYLLNPLDGIPTTVPMHPSFLFETEPTALIMCAFGHQAPTFMIPNGKRCELSVKDPPKNFNVRTIDTRKAIQDMLYVLQVGYITNNIDTLSSKHRDTPLRGPDKIEIWKLLKECYGDVKPAAVEGGEKIVVENDAGKDINAGLW